MDAATAELPNGLAAATVDQPGARMALAAALGHPAHAYLFAGPAGSGKRAAARAFVAQLIAQGAPDPGSAERRVMAEPSPHPDLAWLRPAGSQHLVEDVRGRVIEAVPYRPFEGERRVFVIEEADAMAEESQNALLKTLEEPPPFAHLILVSSQPSALLDTVRSRCQQISFIALAPDAISDRLADSYPDADTSALRAAARLAGGDLDRAGLLLTERGRELRSQAERLAKAIRSGAFDDAPWAGLLAAAVARGEEVGATARAEVEHLAHLASDAGDRRAVERLRREAEEAGKRATRRGRTDALDAGLALLGSWIRDLAAVADGAPDLILTADRAQELGADAAGLDSRRARRAAELVMDTRRRLGVNVSEELAVEALCFRLEFLLRRQ